MPTDIVEGLVSIVLINFNSSQYIFECIKSVKNQTYRNIELLIIDDGSHDGSSEKLKKMAVEEKFRYVYSADRLGFAKANNDGISMSRGEYVMTLNTDVFLENNYIDLCIKAMNGNCAIGTVTGKLLSMRNKNIIDSTGLIIFKEGVATDRGMGEKDHGQYDNSEYVAGACAAAAIYRRKMLNSINYNNEYFDEDFFVSCEDLDLSISGLLLGWETLYLSNAVAYHARGGSTKNCSEFIKFHCFRNEAFFYIKTFRHFNIQSVLLNKMLNFVRLFTVSREIRKRALREKELIKEKLKKKREYFKDRNYKNLSKYLKRSYIVWNIKGRLKRLFFNQQLKNKFN
jgi:GT2 family glycosyltransferase